MMTIGNMPLVPEGRLISRAITEENRSGGKGAGGQEKNGRKGSPVRWNIQPGETYTFADIKGPGCIRHMWITTMPGNPYDERNIILRFYWDNQDYPSVEAPLCDFFGVAHGIRRAYESALLEIVEGRGYNCFLPMPFKKRARLTVTNETEKELWMFWYQVDYTLGDDLPDDTGYFHARFRRCLKTEMTKDFVILDNVRGKGRYIGCNIGVRTLAPMWWGEGEVKIFLDGDDKYPTICGTGMEDYFLSAWGINEHHTQYSGCPVYRMKGSEFGIGDKISCYRWHVLDPVYFNNGIRVTVQQIGNCDAKYANSHHDLLLKLNDEGILDMPENVKLGKTQWDGGLVERCDDICATAYWYQTLPSAPFQPFADKGLRSAFIGED